MVGVKWTFLGKYIWLGECGLGGMESFWGLDRKSENATDGVSAAVAGGGARATFLISFRLNVESIHHSGYF